MIAQRARAAALCGMLVAAAALSQEPQPGVEHDSWREIRVAAVAPIAKPITLRPGTINTTPTTAPSPRVRDA